MSFEFMSTLAESKLIPAEDMTRRWRAHELADLVVLYVSALYILYSYPESQKFAVTYARRTVQYGVKFEKWQSGGTDIYVLLYGLKSGHASLKDQAESDKFKKQMPFGEPLLVKWLREMSGGRVFAPTHRSLFSRLDFNFKINTSSIRAVRRMAMDWDSLENHDKRLTMTRLLQLLKNRAPKCELLTELHKVADTHDLEIDGVCDRESGEGCQSAADVLRASTKDKPSKTGKFLVALAGIAAGVAVSNALDRKK
jgi:hypothetical protein